MVEEGRKKIVIPLASWTEADCTAAIDALTDEIDAGIAERAAGDEIRALFVRGGESFDEEAFFTAVRDRFPGAAPAIRRLIETYADAIGTRYTELFWDGTKSIGTLGHAVQALGVLDHSALPTIRRYGYHVDAEHEQFFARETVSAIIRTHGWSDDVIDFIAWVLLRDFYNSLQDYNEVWSSWGLRDAVLRRFQPETFAQRVATEIEAIKLWNSRRKPRTHGPTRYGGTGMDRLARELPRPHEPWVEAFFLERERIGRGMQQDAAGRGATQR